MVYPFNKLLIMSSIDVSQCFSFFSMFFVVEGGFPLSENQYHCHELKYSFSLKIYHKVKAYIKPKLMSYVIPLYI